eukprot:5248155-Prymnesium_polylepis.1
MQNGRDCLKISSACRCERHRARPRECESKVGEHLSVPQGGTHTAVMADALPPIEGARAAERREKGFAGLRVAARRCASLRVAARRC